MIYIKNPTVMIPSEDATITVKLHNPIAHNELPAHVQRILAKAVAGV